MSHARRIGAAGALGCAAALLILSAAPVARGRACSKPSTITSTLTSTVPDNGDLNPYAVVVAPVSAGQNPEGRRAGRQFQQLVEPAGHRHHDHRLTTPRQERRRCSPSCRSNLPQCPGGVGLTTAMTMLKSGWVIVGSTPSTDGTTATKGAGCLLVLRCQRPARHRWTGPNINGPWGNMAVIDNGATATLFVSMAGFDRARPRSTRSGDRLAGDREQGDGAADRACPSPTANRPRSPARP